MSAEYRVRWEIDLIAESPVEAVKEALAIQRDEASLATCFEVDGRLYEVDDHGNVHKWAVH